MSQKKLEDLPVPVAARADDAFDLVRIWATGDTQQVVLRSRVWEDPAAWGLLLVDVARHVANSYEPDSREAHAKILARIKAGFDVEWSHPTESHGQIDE